MPLDPPTDFDFGDAPDVYKTKLAANGLRHPLNGLLHLGDEIDAEADGQPSDGADADDNDAEGDDGDGLWTGVPSSFKLIAGKTNELMRLRSK